MKAADLREKTTEELVDLASTLRKEEFQMRMQLYTGQLHKSHLLREKRRSVARVETILRERA